MQILHFDEVPGKVRFMDTERSTVWPGPGRERHGEPVFDGDTALAGKDGSFRDGW